ncbi:MAG: DUF423 domain-containing protein [Chitinophagaceae bacterium]|nr:DUF423 domain-containing protein [Chitinophagaceae bacterium]
MHRFFLKIAALLGALSVMLGAFGAHKLKEMVEPATLSTFQTGVTYQFYHALALLAAGILYKRYRNKWIIWSGGAFIAGIILFSGSLYVLTVMQATEKVGVGSIGYITPAGGVVLIAGWLCLFIGIPASRVSERNEKDG